MLKCGKGIFNSFYNKAFFIILMGSSLLLPLCSHAQDDGGGDFPCGGNDPSSTTPCPLDTWVWVLAVIAVIFGAVYLQRSKKIQNQA